MKIRERIEEREDMILSPYAARSSMALRDIDEEPDPLRTAFQRDRDRIIHSKCFRRLKHKTCLLYTSGNFTFERSVLGKKCITSQLLSDCGTTFGYTTMYNINPDST